MLTLCLISCNWMQISQLDARLKELDEERAELNQYQALDKQERSLKYAILDQEIRTIKAELDEVCASAFCGGASHQ